MAEHVVALDLGVRWEPIAPAAILISDDFDRTVLALNPHRDDPNQRCVVMVWSDTRSACMADPNDEAISGHRLYGSGLSQVVWAGVVRESNLIRALETQNRVHPSHDPTVYGRLTHYVILTRERVAEVVAESVSIQRFRG